MADLTTPDAMEAALSQLHPVQFGFSLRPVSLNEQGDRAWQKTYAGIGDVYFTQLDWQHANQYFDWDGTTLSGLEVINALQHNIWALTENNLTSALDMSNLAEAGGYIGVAYRADTGLTPDGWLGFVLGYGSRNGVLASRFLAVKPSVRNVGIARDLKLLQAYAALQTGHHAAEWTFDPMRSINAYLNFNKLGAIAERYKINKYGKLKTSLYGDVPSDRFVVRWNLTNHDVLAHLRAEKLMTTSLEPTEIPTVVPANMNIAIKEGWPMVKVVVPYDIDELMVDDPISAMQQRATVRAVCVTLLNAEIPLVSDSPVPDPAFASVDYQPGSYRVTQVATDPDHRHSFYIFRLKDRR